MEELEVELKKARKRSYALERLFVSRPNGICDATQQSNAFRINDDNSCEHKRDNQVADEPPMKRTNHVIHNSRDCQRNETIDKSRKHSDVKHVSREGLRANYKGDKSLYGTACANESEERFRRTEQINNKSQNSNKRMLTSLMVDNSCSTTETTSEKDMFSSYDTASRQFDTNNNVTSIETYRNTDQRNEQSLKKYEKGFQRRHYFEKASLTKFPGRVFYAQDENRNASICHMNCFQRRSSI